MITPKFNKIYVIESLRKQDRQTGTELYQDILRWRTESRKTSAELIQVGNHNELFRLFRKVDDEVRKHLVSPILHFEMHGDKRGLYLSSAPLVEWQKLYDELLTINTSCKNNLLVTLAVCEGAYLIDAIIRRLKNRTPLWGNIGPTSVVGQGNVAHSFQAFYDELLVSQSISNALQKLDSKIYEFNHCETIFRIGFAGYLEKYHSAKERLKRAELLVTRLKNLHHNKNAPVKNIRRAVKAELRDKLRENFEEMKRNFFMIDLYPENKNLFLVEFDEFVQTY